MLRRSIFVLFTAVLVAIAPPTSAQKKTEVIVVVLHPSNTVGSIGATEMKNIFLGRRKTWSSGVPIRPLIRPPKAPAGLAFFRNVLKMTPARFRHHWQELELSGQGTTPRTITSASAVVEAVAGDRGAVSFMTETEAESAGDDVKIVKLGN